MWSKRKLAQELASRLKKQFEADLEQAKEELKWKNIKKGFNEQLEQFGRDVSRVPEAYQASWRDLRDKMPELRPVHAASLVKQGFVTGVMQTVGQVTGEPAPPAATTATTGPEKREPGRGNREAATNRDNAYGSLTTVWRPRLQMDPGKLDSLGELAASLKRANPDNRFTRTSEVAAIASPVAELVRLLRSADRERLWCQCEELADTLSGPTWEELPETSATLSTKSRESVLRMCDVFFGKAKRGEDELVDSVQRAATRCRGRINFDVLRSFVLSEPEDSATRCEDVKAYADWALDLTAKVQASDHHLQVVEVAIGACRECLRVLAAFAEKQTVSMTVASEAQKYEQSHRYDQICQMLKTDKPKDDSAKPRADDGRSRAEKEENSRKVVELLAGKIVKSVELGLNSAHPVVASFDQAAGIGRTPLAAGPWSTASAAAVAAAQDYVDDRAGDASTRLTELTAGKPGESKPKAQEEIDGDHPAWAAIGNVLTGRLTGISAKIQESLTEQIKNYIRANEEDIKAQLDQAADNARKSLTGKITQSAGRDSAVLILLEQINGKLVEPIVRVIVDNLPVAPTEPLSSGKAQALIASLSKRFETKPITVADTEEFRPTRDNLGNTVECILCAKPRKYTGDLEENLDKICYDVRMANPQLGRGFLFLDNLEFEPVPQYLGSDYADPYADLPEKDARGRRINEFKQDPTALAMGPYGYKVRIGELWGYLDRYKVFTPREVDEPALADWRNRVLLPGQAGQGQVKAGYRSEDGELVEGNWYRPLSKGMSYFLFMPKAGGWHEWAKADTPTGQGSTVGKILERATWEGIKAFRSIS
jgi:hypothetical protein